MAFILSLELFTFPLFFGWLINLLTLSFFGGTLLGRIEFYDRHPFIASILHWELGLLPLMAVTATIYFSRDKIFRPGLLYFIRNSSDPENLLPKEILEKPIIVHIVRLVYSALLYTGIVIVFILGFQMICNTLIPNLLPLSLFSTDTMNHIPCELLARLMDGVLDKILPPCPIDKLAPYFCKRIACLLRLSSYLYGGRYLSEEDLGRGKWVFVPDVDKMYKPEKVNAMFNKRVEAFDIAKITIVEGKERTHAPSIIEMPPEPRRPRRTPIAGQTSRSSDASTKGFTVVYRPNGFKLRILAFSGFIWAFIQTFLVIYLAMPLLVGRYFLRWLLPSQIVAPDINTFYIGLFLVGITVNGSRYLLRLLVKKGPSCLKYYLISLPIAIIKASIVFSISFIVWPLLCGIYFYSLLVPLVVSQTEKMVFSLMLCWLLGLGLLKALLTARQFVVSQQRNSIINNLTSFEGWINIDFVETMTKLIIPYTSRLVILLIGPPFAVLILSPLIGLDAPQIQMLQRWSFHITLAAPSVMLMIWLLLKLRRYLVNRIRDETYLVGRRLHNFERPQIGMPMSNK